MAENVPDFLEETTSGHGDSVAVAMGDESLTYSGLDALSNRIAHVLRDAGALRGDRVALCLDKSILAVGCLYGVMKAGCVCVPTDPNGPPSRLAHILADCGARFLIAGAAKTGRLAEIVASAGALECLVVPDGDAGGSAGGGRRTIDAAAIQAAPVSRAPRAVSNADLACILYTSGSTGRPRGVMISHGNITHFAAFASRYFDLKPADHVSCHAPLHFDLTLFDLHAAICAGASIRLVPQGISFMARDLLAYIADQKISVWQSVPSVLRLLNRQMTGGEMDSIHTVLFAGEPYPVGELRDLMAKAPRTAFYNIYGSTEINDVTCYKVPRGLEGDVLPIGRAWCGADVFAVDEAGVKIDRPGIVGELHARGPTVSPGYWGDTEQTAARFIQNPLHDEFQDRVFRTGDMVQFDREGNLVFAGRRDFLVKIRGNRVNTNEVEQALLSHPGIAAAAVIDLRNEAGDAYLRAFIAGRPGADLDLRGLRRHCLAHIPPYMVPESFEHCESLPQTSTGKIDRQALRGISSSPISAAGQPI